MKHLNLLFLSLVLLFIGFSATAQVCFGPSIEKAELFYQEGKYDQAKQHFEAAKACPDKIENYDLDGWIKKCEDAMRKDFSVSPTQLTFNEKGGKKTITVKASGYWEYVNLPDWCKASKTNSSLAIQCEANNTGSNRTAELIITTLNKEKKVTITQSGKATAPESKPVVKPEPPKVYAVNELISITDVQFANANEAGDIINTYGATLYTDLQFLKTKVVFKKLNNDNKEITLGIKIYGPSGSRKWNNGDYCFTHTFQLLEVTPVTFEEILMGWGSKSGNVYQETGNYTFEIWGEDKLLYSKQFAIIGIPEPPVPEKASVAVTQIRFSNVDEEGNTIDGYSLKIYNDTKYLKAKVTLKKLNDNNPKAVLGIKMYNPNGEPEWNDGDYCFIKEVDLSDKKAEQSFDEILSGWGNKSGTSYKNGTYTYEIWCNNELLIQQRFTVEQRPMTNGPQELAVSKIKFANTDKNGTIITDFGKTLHNDMKYLKAKVTFKKMNLNTETTKIGVKIYNPDGSKKWVDGDFCYLNDIKLGEYQGTTFEFPLTGWGNEKGTSYNRTGKYTYEIWNNNHLITSQRVKVEDKSGENVAPAGVKNPNHLLGISAGYVRKSYDLFLDDEIFSGSVLGNSGINGLQVGCRFDPYFNKTKMGLGLHTGVYYEFYHESSFLNDEYTTFNEHSLYIPLHLLYRYDFNKLVGIYASAGGAADIGLVGTISDSEMTTSNFYGNSEWGGVNRFNFSAEFGGGVQVWRFLLNFTYSLGFSDQHKVVSTSLSFMF